MGQKANAIGNRLGIIRGWDSNWYGGKNYADKLVEDEKIRKYLMARLAKGGVSKIVIERTLKLITVTVHTARPGIVIGKGGQEVDKIKEELKKLVWEMPISKVSIKLGVSNKAIVKRCLKLKIDTPPQGWFLKKDKSKCT